MGQHTPQMMKTRGRTHPALLNRRARSPRSGGIFEGVIHDVHDDTQKPVKIPPQINTDGNGSVSSSVLI